MNEELVTIHNGVYLHEAEFIKSVLEAEGIAAVIPDAFTVGVDPALNIPLGTVKTHLYRAKRQLRELLDE